ncbi:hypothetical protein AB8B22_04060 [Leptotrichia sp. HSP-334]|uniref:Uncharacterized protein n=1 Tax=Leptotrichia rugosa TaxID=3239302 RepID=A0AB39VHM1_9FUSO
MKKNSPEKRSKIRNVFRNLVFKEEQKNESDLENRKNDEEKKVKLKFLKFLRKKKSKIYRWKFQEL